MSAIIWLIVAGSFVKTATSRVAIMESAWVTTSRTEIRETLTLLGSADSKSANNLDQENFFRSINLCAAGTAFCCSELISSFTALAESSSVFSCCLSALFSTWMAAACRLATVVSRTTMISPMMETKSTIAVNAHGRTRLLNGFDARLRLLFTKDFLADYRWGRLREEYNPNPLTANPIHAAIRE